MEPGHRGRPTGLACLVGVFVLAGLLIAGATINQWAHFIMLRTNYGETEGQVLGREIGSDDGATYYVTYRFGAGDENQNVREAVAKKTYHSVQKGQALTVRYTRQNPVIAIIEPGHIGELLFLNGFCLFWNGIVFAVS